MKKLMLTGIILCNFFLVFGQDINGAITEKIIRNIKKEIKTDLHFKAIQNAVSNNDLRKLALNRELIGNIDKHFAYRIDAPGITNQASSGRCWLFTSLNVLRPKVAKKFNLEKFQFSESYLFFYDQLEKANLFLEAIIETRNDDIDDRKVQWFFQHPIGDGGVWSMAPRLIEKYGVVPKEIMPETHHSQNTSMMRRMLRRKLRESGITLRKYANKNKSVPYLRKKKTEMLSEIYRILSVCLGTPPKEFSWRYVEKGDSVITSGNYTPLSFYKKAVDSNLDQYVMLMNDPSKDYYKHYEIEYDRNCYDGPNWTFINLPANELKKYAKTSILNDEPMYFSCDVGKQMNRDDGILMLNQYDYASLLGVPFGMNKKDRVLSYESGSSHGMSLVGVDTAQTGATTKWLLENSWGDKGFDGYMIMTDDWFSEYMFRLVVLKEFLPKKVLDVQKQKTIKLAPWDRMF